MPRLRYLLLQTRNADDAIRAQEVRCFARALDCDANDVAVVDFLQRGPTPGEMHHADMVLLGGSGHYSAAEYRAEKGDGHLAPKRLEQSSTQKVAGTSFGDTSCDAPDSTPWLERSFDFLRDLHRRAKPTFASCWGFQAMARALGGRCIHDPAFAELGTIELHLTDDGRDDPLFGALPTVFTGQAGHEDYVIQLPPDAVLLASSMRVRHQAFRFDDKPIYCTQFHPELNRQAIIERVRAYPEYVERIAAVPHDEFLATVRETPEANQLLHRFVRLVFGSP